MLERAVSNRSIQMCRHLYGSGGEWAATEQAIPEIAAAPKEAQVMLVKPSARWRADTHHPIELENPLVRDKSKGLIEGDGGIAEWYETRARRNVEEKIGISSEKPLVNSNTQILAGQDEGILHLGVN